MALTAQQILENMDCPIKEIEVPDWGGSVFIRKWSGIESDQYNNRLVRQSNEKEHTLDVTGLQAFVAFLSLCDQDGKRLFNSAEQLSILERKSGHALKTVSDAALALNGQTSAKQLGE